MNGSSTLNCSSAEQLIGKFQVINLDKLSTNTVNNHDENVTQIPSVPDDSGSTSRFQIIHFDRNFGRGRWKVHDYEQPEQVPLPTMSTMENESANMQNNLAFVNVPNAVSTDPHVTSSAALAASATTTFQPKHILKTAPTLVPSTANIPSTAGLLRAYPPAPLPNQPYLLPNHPQFGYYPFYPAPYPTYPASWAAAAAALAASNPFLQPTPMAPPSTMPTTGNINDSIRHSDPISDINGENTVMSSTNFPNPTSDQLQNAQLAAAAAAPFLFAAHHSHAPFVPQIPPTASPYATIPSYHPITPLPTIIPRSQPSQTGPPSQLTTTNATDSQTSQQAPLHTSPTHDTTRTVNQQSSITVTAKSKPLPINVFNNTNNDLSKPTLIADLISSSPLITTSETMQPSLISPINVNVMNPATTTTTTTTTNDLWSFTGTGSSLDLNQAAQTAVATVTATIDLLNNENNQNTEIEKEILKQLKTPTKQNNTTDIDNKISAAMDLVKMHLLSAVRDEVTELRQQIRTLNDKLNHFEHENQFLRQYVPSEIYAQYTPTVFGSSSSTDANNLTTTTSAVSSSSQPMQSNSSSLVQQTISSSTNLQQPFANASLSST